MANRRIHPAQMESWIWKLQTRISKFQEKKQTYTKEETLNFIRHQYALMDVTIKALDGKVILVGCSQPSTHYE